MKVIGRVKRSSSESLSIFDPRFADRHRGSKSRVRSSSMSLVLDPTLAARLGADTGLWRDFNDICDCGGRLAGTESEKKAFALLRERVRAASPANSGRSIPVPYNGWKPKRATLRLPGGPMAACHPLVRTIATPKAGLTAEVIDLGRGTPDEFAEQDRKSTRLNSSHLGISY